MKNMKTLTINLKGWDEVKEDNLDNLFTVPFNELSLYFGDNAELTVKFPVSGTVDLLAKAQEMAKEYEFEIILASDPSASFTHDGKTTVFVHEGEWSFLYRKGNDFVEVTIP